MLGRRVSGLSEGLENAAVQCSRQREMVQSMKKELKETQEFIEVRISVNKLHKHVEYCFIHQQDS